MAVPDAVGALPAAAVDAVPAAELYAHYADPSTMIACPGLCERRGRIHGPNAVARPQILHDPLTSIRILSRVAYKYFLASVSIGS